MPDAIIGGDDSVPATLQDATTFRRLARRRRKAEGGRQTSSAYRLPPAAYFRSAFTLTEILIVIAVIVLLIALAVPAFNLIGGSKSIEGATNQLSAALGRARAQAIGLQKVSGVMFFIDPRNNRRSLAIVQETDAPANAVTANFPPRYWLDVVDADYLPLPAGIGGEFICDAPFGTGATPARNGDGYLGFNTQCRAYDGGGVQTDNHFGGVILFDGSGRLISASYGFRCSTDSGGRFPYTNMGRLLFNGAEASSEMYLIPGPANVARAVESQFGLVLFQQDDFVNNGGKDEDMLFSGSTYGSQATPGTEAAEEYWLDNNATPLMINRYNGTLVKGE